jgi:hypothetical protein
MNLQLTTLLRSGENYRKRLMGTGNSLMILNTFADTGGNEGNV